MCFCVRPAAMTNARKDRVKMEDTAKKSARAILMSGIFRMLQKPSGKASNAFRPASSNGSTGGRRLMPVHANTFTGSRFMKESFCRTFALSVNCREAEKLESSEAPIRRFAKRVSRLKNRKVQASKLVRLGEEWY